MNLDIKHDRKKQIFYVAKDGTESQLKYKKIDEETLDFFTVFVPESHRNQGIGAEITDFALQFAKEHDYQILPTCPFVKRYVDEHPQFQDLVAKQVDKKEARQTSLKNYWPLLTLILVSGLAASAINWPLDGGMPAWMHYFMGVFLVMFATLKLFHPTQFADGFAMYDIIAQRSRLYAYCYPLIELLLGLAYLAFFLPILTYIITIVVLTVGAVGVIKALQKGLDINCPCMGTILDVPLSTVTLTEDIGMALMAFFLLVMRLL